MRGADRTCPLVWGCSGLGGAPNLTTSLKTAVVRETEAEWQRVIVDAARLFGWHVEHFRQMIGNPAGFPDLAMWRGDQYLLVELKREGGKPRASQVRWA